LKIERVGHMHDRLEDGYFEVCAMNVDKDANTRAFNTNNVI
jgi:hypothetical protein